MKGSLTCAMAIEKNKPNIAMLIVQSIYAGMALFSKAAISNGMNPCVFVVYRQAFATLSIVPFTFFFERDNAAQLSYTLLWKIFLISLFGTTLSLNLYCFSINHTSATYAAASTNLIPGITFVMAVLLRYRVEKIIIGKLEREVRVSRIECIHIEQWSGRLKVLGFVVSVAGALVFAFVKGPPLNFMYWYPTYHKEIPGTSMEHSSNREWIKGPLLMLLANTAWSFWVIMQAPLVKQYPAKLRLITLQCLFSFIQAAVWAVAMERNISSWKLGWDVNLLSVVYCGALVTGVNNWLQVWAVQKKGPVFTAMFTPLALIITAIFSAFLWKEVLHLGSILGAILLAGGLYSVLWGKSKEVERKLNEQKLAQTKEEVVLASITHQ